MSFLLQLEDGNDFLSIHNGGSDNSEMVAKLTGTIDQTKIAIPGNQMFMVFHTNEEIAQKGFNALIMESKYISIIISYQKLKIGNCIFSLNALISIS